MRAVSLFIIFVILRIAMLWGHPLPQSPWTPLAFLWQDGAVVLGYLAFERMVGRTWPAHLLYGALVLLAVVNAPVALVLSTPVTIPMLRAARGTLADSLLYHATPATLSLSALVLAIGVALPRLRLPRPRHGRVLLATVAAAVVLGPEAGKHVDTAGLERNAVVALARSALPRVTPAVADIDFRASPNSAPAVVENLNALRGAAAGSNVLLVVLESTAAQYLRPYGASEDPTPNLTRLAQRSVVFQNAYAVYPESVKGLVSLVSSRDPAFDRPAEDHMAIAAPSLATRLRDAGYRTALFHSGRFRYLGMDVLIGGMGFDRLEDAGDIGGNRDSSFGIDEDAAVHRILSWIDALPAGRPFFITYLPIAGHHPYAYTVDGPFSPEQEVDRYRNALFEGDAALGTLLDGLRSRGLERATLIVVVSDHGEAFGQHAGNYGHTLALYDENVRVPFILHLPGTESGTRVKRTASLLDVAPTVLDVLGLDAPDRFHGASLLEGPARMALFFTDQSLGQLGLRDRCTKFIHEIESGRSRMFDVCRDPTERNDIAPEFTELVESYAELLRGWSAARVAQLEGSESGE